MIKRLYLGLGSNLGDRKANITKALELLEQAFGTAPEAVSGIVESKAQGFEGPDFLNCAARFACSLDPFEVLRRCKAVERKMGRRTRAPRYDAEGRRKYSSRIIDIDILLYGDIEIDTPELSVPHPRMQERPFVTGPLSEIMNG